MDKATETLLIALKTAMAQPGEQPLYKTGKLPGLFASRTGLTGETASWAVENGMLEIVRREANGKTETELARITPLGVQFVCQQESPKAVLEELVSVMRLTRNGVPQWLDEIRSQLQGLTNRFTELLEKQCHYLDQLARRSEAALARLTSSNGTVTREPWQSEALDYLSQRKLTAGVGDCLLRELFNFLRMKHPDLSLAAFHDGLRRLQDQGMIELLPFQGNLKDLAEPEYALLEGAEVYYAARC